MLGRWGVLQGNFVLSTGLIMRIDHRKEIRKLTFRALALRRSVEGNQMTSSASERKSISAKSSTLISVN